MVALAGIAAPRQYVSVVNGALRRRWGERGGYRFEQDLPELQESITGARLAAYARYGTSIDTRNETSIVVPWTEKWLSDSRALSRLGTISSPLKRRSLRE
jgi:hypothetical protein